MYLGAFRRLLAINRRPVPYLFCLPFPNRASNSGDLYIVFDRNQLTFPVALLFFQVEDRFNHSFPNHAYASHIASRISYHVCIMLLEHCTWLIVFLLLVVLAWVETGDEYVIEEPIEYAYEDQAFVFSEIFAGKMTIPSKSLLSLLASCSLYGYAAIPTTCYIMPPILPCQASNPPCPSKALFGYVTALLSPSYSVVSCR